MSVLLVNLSTIQGKADAIRALSGLQGMHRIEIKRCRPKRSSEQNALYHVARVEPFRQFLREQGHVVSHDTAHELIKNKFLRVPIIDESTGEMLGERTRSTTELNVQEFREFLDQVDAWLHGDLGIRLTGRGEDQVRASSPQYARLSPSGGEDQR